jgi:[acyl-carrier-protein] S-malonyltransferase
MTSAVLFAGQGAQAVGMGRSLYEHSAQARDLYDEADAVLGWSVRAISFAGPEAELTLTRVCQPALFVHGFALFTLLRQAGRLDGLRAALGLSLGEITALTAAGAFSFADGLRVVAERGRLMQEACDLSRGAMASLIGGSRAAAAELCRTHDVDLANLNCPGQIVISGAADQIAAAVAAAKADGQFRMIVPLKVAGAYHSRLMEPARARFAAFLRDVPVRRPECAVFSNTTGAPVGEPDEIRAALERQVVSSVLWEDCMRAAAALGIDTFYECGPGAVLGGLARRTERAWQVVSLAEFADLPL